MNFVKTYGLLTEGLKDVLKDQGLQNAEMLIVYGSDRYPEVKLGPPFVRGETARINGYIEVGVRVADSVVVELADVINALPDVKAKVVSEGGETSILYVKYWPGVGQ